MLDYEKVILCSFMHSYATCETYLTWDALLNVSFGVIYPKFVRSAAGHTRHAWNASSMEMPETVVAALLQLLVAGTILYAPSQREC